MHEVELKILLTAVEESALRRRIARAPGAVGRARSVRLRAIYFDTPDRALSHARIALRLRKEGRAWVQAVKSGGAMLGGLSTPREAECSAPGARLDIAAIPDPALREAVIATLGDAPPAPVFETDMRRTIRAFAGPDGGVVELSIDVGEVRVGDVSEGLREAELELKHGSPRDLYAVAAQLFPTAPIRFSRRSKAERGFALADGAQAVAPIPSPVFARKARLSPEMRTEDAATAVLRACADQVLSNIAVVALSDDPAGPHQLRVGLRRLRTALTLFRKGLDGPASSEIDLLARALSGSVGGLRDIDVLIDGVIAPAADQAPVGVAPLIEALRRRRVGARAALRKRLATPEIATFTFALGAFVESAGWRRADDPQQMRALERSVMKTARAALDRRWKRVARLAEHIDALEGEARHDLRKAVKKLRYAVVFFRKLWPGEEPRAFLAALKTMQDDLGALQDAAMAEQALLGPHRPASRDPKAQLAAGLIVGWWRAEAERRWGHVRADWRALCETPRFWRD